MLAIIDDAAAPGIGMLEPNPVGRQNTAYSYTTSRYEKFNNNYPDFLV